MGSSGTLTGGSVIFTDILPLEKRPKYQGFLGATFGLASILGPLLGGTFTSQLTWRWCFWINLPIGAVACLGLIFILPAKEPPKRRADETLLQHVKCYDPIGTAIVLPGLILLLLALQWGGTDESWSSARVIACLIISIVLLSAFAISQPFLGDDATLPVRVLRKRSIWAGAIASLGFGSTLIVLTFYLPIWNQAIKGDSPQAAGVRMLPYFLSTVIFVIGAGIAVSKVGYYAPFLIIGTALTIVGCGLLSTFKVDTDFAMAAGYQASVHA